MIWEARIGCRAAVAAIAVALVGSGGEGGG